jgi:anti-sigma factor ChrR (cupin superfamily)
MSALNCPAREELLDYALGRLPEKTIEVVAQHIEQCPECQATLATLADAEDTLVAQLAGPPEPDAFADEPECQELLVRAKALVGGDDLGDEIPATEAYSAKDGAASADELGTLPS